MIDKKMINKKLGGPNNFFIFTVAILAQGLPVGS